MDADASSVRTSSPSDTLRRKIHVRQLRQAATVATLVHHYRLSTRLLFFTRSVILLVTVTFVHSLTNTTFTTDVHFAAHYRIVYTSALNNYLSPSTEASSRTPRRVHNAYGERTKNQATPEACLLLLFLRDSRSC